VGNEWWDDHLLENSPEFDLWPLFLNLRILDVELAMEIPFEGSRCKLGAKNDWL